MPSRSAKILRSLAVVAAVFAFCLVMFGAFVRLSNAGLSCPDWPTCYGEATWPGHAHEIAQANQDFPDRPFETHKAWREQVHRFLAGTLGMLVLAMALLAVWRRWLAFATIIVSAAFAAVGVGMYMRGEHVISSVLSAFAIGLPLLAAASLRRPGAWRISVVALGVIIFQAMLGMWTVTLLLKPVVVLGHLLGGLCTFALLAWAALRFAGVGSRDNKFGALRMAVGFGIVLLVCQIALGGWTSSNYAALACGTDFPKCLGQWWPATDFHEGFVLWRGVGVNYEGGVLDMAARSAIQMAHRIGALIVFCYLGWLSHRLAKRGLRGVGIAVGVVLLTQVGLGIGNVHLGLPLPVAILHNGVAALLLFTLLYALARTQQLPHAERYASAPQPMRR
jgi:cytochrome c oxidase assembly protein subunit 15